MGACLRRRRSVRALLLATAALLALFFFWRGPWLSSNKTIHEISWVNYRRNALVVASLEGDDVSWLQGILPEWEKNIYIVNNASANATLTIPKNKGRESMVYLRWVQHYRSIIVDPDWYLILSAFDSFVIDNYDHLPNITIFMHSLRYQWHNDDPLYGMSPLPTIFWKTNYV